MNLCLKYIEIRFVVFTAWTEVSSSIQYSFLYVYLVQRLDHAETLTPVLSRALQLDKDKEIADGDDNEEDQKATIEQKTAQMQSVDSQLGCGKGLSVMIFLTKNQKIPEKCCRGRLNSLTFCGKSRTGC